MGARALPTWLVKYAKSHVFGALEADFLWKIENSPPIGKQPPLKRLNFRIWPKNQSQFRWRPLFFLETTWFWAEKTFEFRISAEKSDSISAKTFFFFLETTCFWADKTFEFPSFPRNFVWICGQTVWNWFKNNENSGQGRLHFSHSFKIAPPFPNPGYAPGYEYLKTLPMSQFQSYNALRRASYFRSNFFLRRCITTTEETIAL